MPPSGTSGVDSKLAEIRVTYSKPMTNGSWSWSTWGEENFPKTTGKPRYEADKRTCVLPVKLEPNKFYAVWLNSGNFSNFKDSGGRPAVPYLLVLISSNFLTSLPGRTVWGLVQASMIYLILAHASHRKLQPWCPWCSDGGGGEDVDETPPVLPQDDRERV